MWQNQDSSPYLPSSKTHLSLFHYRVFYPKKFVISHGKALENAKQGDDMNSLVFQKGFVHGSTENVSKQRSPGTARSVGTGGKIRQEVLKI